MRAFVLKIKEFFKLDKPNAQENFSADKRELRIPLYQREYKWENDKINALITDVRKQSKFLGNIILEEADNCYEIADGQQRITTCYLILTYLYNYYRGSPLEQQSVANILKPYGSFILKNETVGTYLCEQGDQIKLDISETADIYYQKADFDRVYDAISAAMTFITTPVEARDFKEKLLNSEVIVLISDQTTTTPIEQIFLDINEKAQLLDVEDIFKGHCFEIFSPEFYSNLRDTWVNLKKCAVGFKKFGIKTLGDYIYLFLLEHDNAQLPKKLNVGGQHYLEGKTMDATDALLQEMILYGNNILRFHGNLQDTNYRFEDICSNSHEYRATHDHIALKNMCTEVLRPIKPIYQELPFMYFVHALYKDEQLRNEITHPQLRRVITNLYIYSVLFVLNNEKKSKDVIDHSIRDAIGCSENRISETITAAKALRVSQVEGYSPNPQARFEELAVIYSITDNFISNDNWIPSLYSRNEDYNLEHLVIPDQRAAKIKWNPNGASFDIPVDLVFAKGNKKKTCNYLVLDRRLNEDLNNFDAITKIRMIRNWHNAREIPLPKHIDTIISHIESFEDYRRLVVYQDNNAGYDTVYPVYRSFLTNYFSDEQEQSLLANLKIAFVEAFHN